MKKLYFLLYGAVYVGWLCHRSEDPFLFGYSGSYIVFLLLLALPFLLPASLAYMRRRLGAQEMVFALLPLAFCLLLAGIVANYLYYRGMERIAFHPFLQNGPSPQVIRPGGDAAPVLKILVLGGSTTANLGLEPEERYPTLLQRKLTTALDGAVVEVINAGAGWFTSQDSLIFLTTYGRQYSPDVVVVMHAINDLSRSFLQPNLTQGEYDPHYAHYYGASARAMRRPSFSSYVLDDILAPRFLKSWYSKLRAKDVEVDRPLDQYPSLDALERNLGSIVRFCRSTGAIPVLVTQPTLYKPTMSDEELGRSWLRRTLLWEKLGWTSRIAPTAASLHRAMAAFNERVRSVAQAERVVVAEGELALPRDLKHFRDDCHYTPKGAEALAQTVSEAVLAARDASSSSLPPPWSSPSTVDERSEAGLFSG